MIEIKNVSKKYGDVQALSSVTFSVNDGDIYGFIGHNGAGKTSLIKAMVGIHDIDEGDILYDGKSILNDAISCKKDIAYLADIPLLYDNMKVFEFINFVCDMYGVEQRIRYGMINHFAEIFDLTNKMDEEISSLSRGMKQKAALVAALSHDPKFIILDEPFLGLDPKAVFDCKELMREMAREGKTIFFSTHILEVAERLCSQIAIIKNGKIIATGPIDEIKGEMTLERAFLHYGV